MTRKEIANHVDDAVGNGTKLFSTYAVLLNPSACGTWKYKLTGGYIFGAAGEFDYKKNSNYSAVCCRFGRLGSFFVKRYLRIASTIIAVP